MESVKLELSFPLLVQTREVSKRNGVRESRVRNSNVPIIFDILL
jgi:hypothetical protein